MLLHSHPHPASAFTALASKPAGVGGGGSSLLFTFHITHTLGNGRRVGVGPLTRGFNTVLAIRAQMRAFCFSIFFPAQVSSVCLVIPATNGTQTTMMYKLNNEFVPSGPCLQHPSLPEMFTATEPTPK